jgi:hypothetical protein
MALPRPEVPLVSIELGLIARFSTEEGVLWIQAQLTDNSWLLHESVRLTGGFAFVSWFDGPRAGEFVVTMGGFHPSFHREGYPVVPRLGFNWQVASAIVIKGENYFALTSEALMAGGKLEASAKFGPAWAEVKFGADGIVYFDPFRFEVEVYARIAAGVTIDFWIGEVTISISLGARIRVEGPKFRGVATFEVGPIELTVAFGDTQKAEKVYLSWDKFVPKYLEEARPGVARCVSSITGKGSLQPGPGEDSKESGTADGSAEKPFEVLSEFEFNVTTIVPTMGVKVGFHATFVHTPSRDIGLAPVGDSSVNTTLVIRLRDSDGDEHAHNLDYTVHRADGFPVGVWGNPQEDDDRKVPKGEVIEAVDGLLFEAVASIEGSLPEEMAYHQIESGPRKPLPFFHLRADRARLVADATDLVSVLPDVSSVAETYTAAIPWLIKGGNGNTAIAALERDRQAPPRLGSLSENIAPSEPNGPDITLPPSVTRPAVDAVVKPPRAIAVLSPEILEELPAVGTTVGDRRGLVAATPPTFDEIDAALDWSIPAKLVRVATPAAVREDTLIATNNVPLTRGQSQGVGAVSRRGASFAGQKRLAAFNQALGSAPEPIVERSLRRFSDRQERSAPTFATQATLSAGEIAVLRLPNAERDVDTEAPRPSVVTSGGPTRVLAMSAGGRVLSDSVPGRAGLAVPRGTERIVVVATGKLPGRSPALPSLLGWHDGQSLAYIGWGSALISGGCLCVEGSRPGTSRQRFRAGWISASRLIDDAPLITTRFHAPLRSIAVVIDDARDLESAGTNLSIGLSGASRVTGSDGAPIPPELTVTGNRSILVYAVKSDQDEDKSVVVSIARQDGFRVSGVLASRNSPESVVELISEQSLDQLVRRIAPGQGGDVKIGWRSARRKRKRANGAKELPE